MQNDRAKEKRKMLKIGITGNIATGKTTVTKIFEDMGIPVVSCDELVRSLQNPGNVLWMRIKQKWGDSYFKPDYTLDREKVAANLFENHEFRTQLQDLTHPLIKQELVKIFSIWKDEGKNIAAAEMPLLFEAGWENLFHKIILTCVSREIQIKRIVEKRNMDIQTAKKWINIQKDKDEKKHKVDIVIDTGGGIEETKSILEEFIKKISDTRYQIADSR